MFKIKETELGEITVEREVIETIAGIDSIRKGVSVRSSEQGLIVDVHVIVGYGIKIREVAHNVMQKVSYVLEHNAGITIAQVNVNVKGVKVLGEK